MARVRSALAAVEGALWALRGVPAVTMLEGPGEEALGMAMPEKRKEKRRKGKGRGKGKKEEGEEKKKRKEGEEKKKRKEEEEKKRREEEEEVGEGEGRKKKVEVVMKKKKEEEEEVEKEDGVDRGGGGSGWSDVALVEAAEKALGSGDVARARLFWRASIFVNPRVATAWLAMGRCEVELGNVEAGARCFTQAVLWSGDFDSAARLVSNPHVQSARAIGVVGRLFDPNLLRARMHLALRSQPGVEAIQATVLHAAASLHRQIPPHRPASCPAFHATLRLLLEKRQGEGGGGGEEEGGGGGGEEEGGEEGGGGKEEEEEEKGFRTPERKKGGDVGGGEGRRSGEKGGKRGGEDSLGGALADPALALFESGFGALVGDDVEGVRWSLVERAFPLTETATLLREAGYEATTIPAVFACVGTRPNEASPWLFCLSVLLHCACASEDASAPLEALRQVANLAVRSCKDAHRWRAALAAARAFASITQVLVERGVQGLHRREDAPEARKTHESIPESPKVAKTPQRRSTPTPQPLHDAEQLLRDAYVETMGWFAVALRCTPKKARSRVLLPWLRVATVCEDWFSASQLARAALAHANGKKGLVAAAIEVARALEAAGAAQRASALLLAVDQRGPRDWRPALEAVWVHLRAGNALQALQDAIRALHKFPTASRLWDAAATATTLLLPATHAPRTAESAAGPGKRGDSADRGRRGGIGGGEGGGGEEGGGVGGGEGGGGGMGGEEGRIGEKEEILEKGEFGAGFAARSVAQGFVASYAAARVLEVGLLWAPRAGELWAHVARLALNPFSGLFDLSAARAALGVASRHTSQAGDTLVAALWLRLLERVARAPASLAPPAKFGGTCVVDRKVLFHWLAGTDVSHLATGALSAPPAFGFVWSCHKSAAGPAAPMALVLRLLRREVARTIAAAAPLFCAACASQSSATWVVDPAHPPFHPSNPGFANDFANQTPKTTLQAPLTPKTPFLAPERALRAALIAHLDANALRQRVSADFPRHLAHLAAGTVRLAAIFDTPRHRRTRKEELTLLLPPDE